MDGRIHPVCKFSSMKALQASTSWGFSGYNLATFGTNESLRSMAWSKLQQGEGVEHLFFKYVNILGVLGGKDYIILCGSDSEFGGKGGFSDVFIME